MVAKATANASAATTRSRGRKESLESAVHSASSAVRNETTPPTYAFAEYAMFMFFSFSVVSNVHMAALFAFVDVVEDVHHAERTAEIACVHFQ